MKEKSAQEPEKLNLPDLVDETSEKISRLRRQQEILQKQKTELEGLNARRQELVRGQAEMKLSLSGALAVLEREVGELQRSLQLVESFREQFAGLQEEVSRIDEESWDAADIKKELNQALAVVDRARRTYNEARGKIAALSCGEREREITLEAPAVPTDLPRRPAELLQAGFFFFLPPVLLVLLLLVLLRLLERF